MKISSVIYENKKVASVIKNDGLFDLTTSDSEMYKSKTIIIATGLKDNLPDIENISYYYGKSLFSCPYCEGWESRDRPLVVIIDDQVQGFHFIQTVYNWSKDLVVCTNGKIFENSDQKRLIQKKGIKIIENKVKAFTGENGLMEKVVFENGESVTVKGGFVLPKPSQTSDFPKEIECEFNSLGGILTDSYGRTNIKGVYSAGDASIVAPAQLIIAVAEGLQAAVGVNKDLIETEFLK